jgi:hypothetical protein
MPQFKIKLALPEGCMFPVCSCYPDTASQCDQETCAYPDCECHIPSSPQAQDFTCKRKDAP